MTTLTHSEWITRAEALQLRSQAFIDGEFRDSRSGKTFTTINPATGRELGAIAACDELDVDDAVRAARSAFDSGSWSQAGVKTRRETLLRFAELVESNRHELALLDSLDMGKRVADAYEIDVPAAVEVLRFYAEAIDKLSGEIAPTRPGTLALVSRVPLGVVGAVIPWNFPIEMFMWKVAPALAAGNAVVVKPASESALSALRLAELASEAGLPDGILNVVPGSGSSAGQALGRHLDVDCLAFTGSTEVGKLFLGYAAESNMKQVWLECGGKSPNIIFDDVHDLPLAVERAAADIFFNQGQACSAHSRLLVQKGIKDEVATRLKAASAQYQPGDPLDPDSGMGAMVSTRHTDSVLQHIESGRSQARVLCGGNRVEINGSDAYIEPTIFDGVDAGSALAQDEIFGPVLSVIDFDDESDAVRIANDSAYGLAASVWTADAGRAYRLGNQLVAGTVSINTVDELSAQTPFGGFKGSGFGRDLSLHSLEKYGGLKTIWIQH